MKTDAPFWQPKYLFNCPLSAFDARVTPKIEFAPSWKLFLRGLSFHKEMFAVDVRQLQRIASNPTDIRNFVASGASRAEFRGPNDVRDRRAARGVYRSRSASITGRSTRPVTSNP
jgi:hypothetical protein